MPNKVFKSQHWRIECKQPSINNTDILDEIELNQAKQKLLSELEILLESDVFPMFNRVIIKESKAALPEK